MSGSGTSPADHHLGDRLAALVDGELSHDARERVLAHLATCPRCKAEADAQRRVKSMFTQAEPPPLSEGLLARLQGLPGQPSGPEGPPGPFPGGGFRTAPVRPGTGARPPAGTDPFGGMAFGTVLGGGPVRPDGRGGFRVHEVGRPRRRFAFVAAGAVSLAALALGGALPLDPAEQAARGDGSAVTPAVRPGPAGFGPAGGALSVADASVRAPLPTPDGLPSPYRIDPHAHGGRDADRPAAGGPSPSPLPPVATGGAPILLTGP
ncbi:anti-sigma factor family protein [Streptomyces sp. BI20]|uniref:anti-sigma factor family protein n=1 Tax=Streptomyces sp. BI20 TaxID=3403460 RepID=UPI003C7279E5